MTLEKLLFLVAAVGATSCAPAMSAVRVVPSADGSPLTFVAHYDEPVGGTKGDVLAIDVWGLASTEPTQVRFGNVPGTVSAISAKRIEVVVPAGDGTVDVCVSNGTVSWVLVGAFRYTRSSAAITRRSPGA